MSNLTGQLNKPEEVTLKMRSQKQLMTTWTTSPILCSLKCSRRRLQKTFDGSYLTRIQPDWRWKMRTRCTSLTTGSKWTRSPALFMPSTKRPTTDNTTNRTLRLFDCNRGSKIMAFSPTPTEATTAQGARTTDQTTTATDKTTARIASPSPTLPETVNFVSTAKSWITPRKNAVKESMTINHVSQARGKFTGQKWAPPMIIPIPCNKTAIPVQLNWFFIKERHGTPHERSKCHSTINLKFVYNFHRNVQ